MVISPSTSVHIAVGAASVDFALALVVNRRYIVVSTTDAYMAQGTGAQTAAVATGSALVPAGTPMILDGRHGDTVGLIQATVGGLATITPAFDR